MSLHHAERLPRPKLSLTLTEGRSARRVGGQRFLDADGTGTRKELIIRALARRCRRLRQTSAAVIANAEMALTNENSVLIEICARPYGCSHQDILPTENCLMHTPDNVIDLTLFRKRRQARTAAELMWTMYTSRAGLTALTVQMTTGPVRNRQA